MQKMKNYKVLFFMALGALLSPFGSFGQDRAAELLRKMSDEMRSLGGDRAAFSISADEEQLLGSFAVEGERYRIELADVEVYGEAAERYEVNKTRREVTIMQTDTASVDILSNPAHAFDLVGRQYKPVLLSESAGEATLSLQEEANPRVKIRLTMDVKNNRPTAIIYGMDGLEMKIQIHAITPLKESLSAFDRAQYEAYELIDFR